MTDFTRTRYAVRLVEKGALSKVIRPQAIVCSYSANSIPVANVDLAFGQSFSDSDGDRLQEDMDLLDEWAADRKMLQIYVDTVTSDTTSPDIVEKTEMIFEGRVFVPSLRLLRSSAAKSFQLQHWTGDLSIGSVMMSYALPGNPQQKTVSAIFNNQPLGDAGFAKSAQLSVEGIAFRLGLPVNWYQDVTADVWANGKKAILAAIVSKDFPAEFTRVFEACGSSMHQPAQVAIDALERIQGPSPKLGTNYSSPAAPLAIRQDLAAASRDLLGRSIAYHLGHDPTAAGQTLWQQTLSFCSDFGLQFIPRPGDAVITPFNVGSSVMYDVSAEEIDTQEVAWSAFQQTTVRGVGILSPHRPYLGAAEFAVKDPRLLPHGCHIASDDPNDGLVYFTRPPVWLANVPPHSVLGAAAKQSFRPIGIHKAPGDTAEPSSTAVDQGNLEQSLAGVYDEYAKLRYLESELRGRVIRCGMRYRTDIAPGSMLRVQLRPDRLISRLNLNTETVVGVVTQMSLAISRKGRQAVSVYNMDYGRVERQVADPQFSVDNHPIFESTVSGLPLVEQ